MADEKQQPGGFSFGFSKKKEASKLVKSAIADEVKEDRTETEFVTSLEDREVVGTKPKEEKKVLVIPLIKQNKWQTPTPQDLEQTDAPLVEKSLPVPEITKTGDDITDQALQELVTEAHMDQENREGRGIPEREIPLLMKNKAPEGSETDDRLDVSIRPDEAAMADYDQVPIEEYGMALLRGMGFKEGEGIGRNKKAIAPIEAVARPKGLGLGADRSLSLQQKEGGGQQGKDTQNTERLEMKKGGFCIIQAGKHQGMYASIEGIDEDNSRVVVKLAIGNSVVTLNQLAVTLVNKKDFDKNSKYLNKSKVDEYKEKEAKRNRHRSRSKSRDRSSHRSRDEREYDNRSKDTERHERKHNHHSSHNGDRHRSHTKRSHKDSDYDSDHSQKRKKDRHRSPDPSLREEASSKHRSRDRRKDRSHYDEEPSPKDSRSRKNSWLRPNLKVRVIDKDYKNGDYYKTKVFVEDVISLDLCNCRTDKGKLLEGLSVDNVETVIPKDTNTPVMVVSGKHRGKVGKILEKDSSSCTTMVQILPDCDEILSLDYDRICEYVGSVHELG